MSDRPQFSVEIEQRSDERALVVVCGEVDIYTALSFMKHSMRASLRADATWLSISLR